MQRILGTSATSLARKAEFASIQRGPTAATLLASFATNQKGAHLRSSPTSTMGLMTLTKRDFHHTQAYSSTQFILNKRTATNSTTTPFMSWLAKRCISSDSVEFGNLRRVLNADQNAVLQREIRFLEQLQKDLTDIEAGKQVLFV